VSPAQRDAEEGAVGGLDRAAAILAAFDPSHRELTLASLVRRSGLPRSTAHRTAERMIRLGWLDKPDHHYRIGNRLFELSGLAPIRHELREAVLPFLQDLYAATKSTVQLGILDGPNVLIVDKITGHRPMPMLSQVGGTIPTHCSGLGRAILAWSDTATVDAVLAGPLTPRTSRTLTTADAIRRELAAIPDRGWAVDREEGNVGVSCVAAPIFGPLGDVAAAVSVTGPSAVVKPERVGPAVRLAAAAASRAYTNRR
jgi:DNA-binding IclR family transcriptional regulator